MIETSRGTRGVNMTRAILLLGLVLGTACSRERAGNATASAYTSDSDSSAKAAGVEGTNSGSELEAPRLIPAIQNQLNLMSAGGQPTDQENLNAYKNLAGDAVNAMAADLNRAGLADSGNFQTLKDSVLNDLGGGAGTNTDLNRSELPAHIARMRRLISMYQQGMRGAGDRQ
jgi:hypothetical protein